MGKFDQDVPRLLELVGGKSNVAALTHCVTRLRFVLSDPSKAQTDEIEKLKTEKCKGNFYAGRAVSGHYWE